MHCANCGNLLGTNSLKGGYCSVFCEAAAEHEKKLLENEHMSILMRTLDDGGHSVQINLRQLSGIQELTRNYDTTAEAMRGIAKICTAVADGLENEESE